MRPATGKCRGLAIWARILRLGRPRGAFLTMLPPGEWYPPGMRGRRIVLWLSPVLSGPAGAAEVGYYSQPAIHGDRVVFVSEGDLWVTSVGAAVGEPVVAWRLTSGDGNESRPQLSPDGRW